jgi:hypothetical protein
MTPTSLSEMVFELWVVGLTGLLAQQVVGLAHLTAICIEVGDALARDQGRDKLGSIPTRGAARTLSSPQTAL